MSARPLSCGMLLVVLLHCRPSGPTPVSPMSDASRPTPAPTVPSGRPVDPTGPAVGTRGMVSSAHPLATQAGLDVLAAGGNAFDAAVAVAATLNVVEPMNSGIGGYGTLLIYDAKQGRSRFLNASGRIPRGVDSDAFRAPTPGYLENRKGAKSVSTPGNVHAWKAMSEAYGTRPWKELFAPALRAAREGFPLNAGAAADLAAAFPAFPSPARAIYSQGGRGEKPLGEGDLLVQQDLGRSLVKIAEEGPEALYGGTLGQAVDKAMQSAGGFLALADLTADRAEWWDPISIRYRGYEVVTTSPPSNAFPMLIRLGILSRFDVAALGSNSPEYLHRFAEVTKRAFWCRLAYAGDPDLSPPPLSRLLSEAYWTEEARQLDPAHARPFVPPGPIAPAGSNTTHFVVADRWGNLVSATQTLGNTFGSRVMPPGTGIWLNDSLAYCTFEPKGNPMDAHAGHRKLSGDCPTFILKDGRPWVAIGTPGGHTIDQTVAQMVVNLVDFHMDIRQAIATPRVSFIEPDQLGVEGKIPEAVRRELAARGHNVQVYTRLGNAHGLTVDYDAAGHPVRFTGAADPRGDGLAKGY